MTKQVKHKVISASSISMCGIIVTDKNKTSKWEDTDCKECLKHITPWGLKRIINKRRLVDEKVYN